MNRIIERQLAYLAACERTAAETALWQPSGRLVRVTGMVMEATGIKLPVGSACQVELPDQHVVEAEVVGFSGDRVYLMPLANVHGLVPGTPVRPLAAIHPPAYGKTGVVPKVNGPAGRQVPVGESLLGRILDSLGRPLDGKGPIHPEAYFPLYSQPMNPLDRSPVKDVLDVGVRAINGLLTVGRGQRLGLFAGSGVGKSVLLGMMARFTRADVVVVGLIGERGREVKDFIENILGEEGIARSVVVAAPADVPPLMRLHGAAYATALAEYFRAQGKDVLLLMDSVTRYAMAQREIALAIGEPPVTKGYPPSVFARLPQLIERAGNAAQGGGSITGFYTVLSEGDDQQDPIADSARAILDGTLCAVARFGRSRALPRHRYRAVHQPGDGGCGDARANGQGALLQAVVLPLPAQPRSDQRWRLCAGFGPDPGRSHSSSAAHDQLSDPAHARVARLCLLPATAG